MKPEFSGLVVLDVRTAALFVREPHSVCFTTLNPGHCPAVANFLHNMRHHYRDCLECVPSKFFFLTAQFLSDLRVEKAQDGLPADRFRCE